MTPPPNSAPAPSTPSPADSRSATAPRELAVLMVEDSESDALLVLRALRRAGFALRHRRVEDGAGMRAALAGERWDVVLSDFNLPGFDARSALAELHASGLDLPFIVVSGTIGDEIAIELMRRGAHDYLMRENLARLAPAIERELGEARVRAERRRALAALHDSEAVLREAQRIGGVGQWRRDLPGGAPWCSDTLFALFGMAPVAGEDALDALLTRVHPDDLGRLLQAHRELAAGSEHVELEYRIVHADGSLRYVLECAARSRGVEAATPRLIGTVHDVTAQRAAAEALRTANARLRQMSLRVLDAQEAERRAVAYELHDQIGQALTAVKLDLQAMTPHLDAGPAVARLAAAIHTTEEALAQVRGLSLNLRPPQLDYMGLEASLRWHAERECARAGLALDFAGSVGEFKAEERCAIVCFRLLQEALTNVVRHAAAKRVRIALSAADGRLDLEIADDGRGFDLARARRRMLEGASVGLLGMEERAALIGGEVRIDAAPGAGTRIRVSLPCTAHAAAA